MHADEVLFLNAILREPNEDTPRLIYADWLEERGDSRCEYLRLEVDLSHPKNKRARRELNKKMSKVSASIDCSWIDIIVSARQKHADIVQEFVWVNDGNSILDVMGGARESVIMLNGDLLAFNWNDDPGGYSQYLVVNPRADFTGLVPQLEDVVLDGSGRNVPLGQQIQPLLRVLGRGLYALLFTPNLRVWTQVIVNKDMQNFQSHTRTLICTQTQESLDWPKIRRIRSSSNGNRTSMVITASVKGSRFEFVIAGQNELECHAGAVNIVRIERCNAPRISLKQGCALLPNGHPGTEEYRRMKMHPTAKLEANSIGVPGWLK